MKIERRKAISANLDLTPLIDIVFQLIIFLLVASNFTQVKEALVELPKSEKQENLKEQVSSPVVTLVIHKDNKLQLLPSDLVFKLEELETQLQQNIQQSKEKRLEIRGDKESNLATFVKVMEAANEYGFKSVGLFKMVEKK